MALEQYIVRELKRDIKYLIQKVADLEQKLEEAHPTPKPTEQKTAEEISSDKHQGRENY